MKVFNLSCEHDHVFEGWFDSTAEFERQQRESMLVCPMCESATVRRLPSAPRLNLSSQRRDEAVPSQDAQAVAAQATPAQLQAVWLRMARHIQENTEDVGKDFASEARKIHYHEAPERGIRGLATADDAAALSDEGIEVIAFPMPDVIKGPLQ